MSEFLFNEFDTVSAKQWKQKIQFDLKGADYNDTLIWQSAEGIDVKPFYHKDDFKEDLAPIPGHPKNWSVAQDVFIDDTAIANSIIQDALNNGADALVITSEKEFDPSIVFQNISFDNLSVYFNLQFLSEGFIAHLKQYFSDKETNVFYNIDIIGNLARSGNWYTNLKNDHEVLEQIISKNKDQNILSIDVTLYQNAGANMVQQLAYGLAHVTEYLNHFTKDNSQNLNITFQVAVGSNYFFEIAKIRTLRRLYALIATEFGVSENCQIIAKPSKRNKTIYDYNVNMLRTTTECMSAILGGANTINNMPYDYLYHKSNEFGERISRNQLLVLKAESYFETASNPADGSYYIEQLTNELAEKALALFKDIEKNGGFLKQLKEGTIQKKIKESADKEQQLFDDGKLVLLGTNKHPNLKDQMKNDLELYPFVKTDVRKTLIRPVIEKRLAEKTEKTRLENE